MSDQETPHPADLPLADGDYDERDDEGRPRQYFTIGNGRLQGLARFYDEGALIQEAHFKDGLLEGDCIF